MELVGALVFTFVVVTVGLVYLASRSGHMDELNRLSKHSRRLAEKKPLEAAQQDIFAAQRDDYLSRLLAQAGLEARYETFKTQWMCAAIGCGIVLMALGWGTNPALGIAGLLFGIPIGAAAFIGYINHLAKSRQAKMTEQLPQVLESMVSSLRAGSPVMETFKVLSETAPEPIRSEFKRALVSLQLGKSFRDAILEMSNRIRTPDFRLLAQAIFISQDVGANLADVVATIAECIRERFKLRDFMNSLTAQGKATAVFIGVLPYGITALTYCMTPGYIIPFFNNLIARAVFIALIFWEFIGFWILMKLTTFEV